MSVETVEEAKNEEEAEIVNNEVIETTNEEQPAEQIKQEETVTAPIEEIKEDAPPTPKAKPKAQPKKLARSVKVVELVECSACNKTMLPKSLRNTHPYYCKGQPTETLPVNKQKASYGSKVEQKLRKEIEEEIKKKYENKENDKNTQNVENEVVSYSEHEVSCSSSTLREPIQVRKLQQKPREAFATQAKPKPVKMEESRRQLTATDLLQQSYNEMKRLKQQEKQEKINRFKLSMF